MNLRGMDGWQRRSLVMSSRMKKNIVVNAFSGQNPNRSTFVSQSRIIERPPTRVFHSCLLPSTVFNEPAASCTSSRIWMYPLHQVDLVTLCRKSVARAPHADGFLIQLLVTFLQMRRLLLALCRSSISPSIQILISNGVQTRAHPKSLVSGSLAHQCSLGLILPEYSQTTTSHAECRRTAHVRTLPCSC